MTVAELLERISSEELTEWMLYERIEPFEGRADLRAAMVTSTIANANRNPKTRRKPFTPQDFMPPDSIPKAPSVETESAADRLRKLAAAMGARVVSHGT